MKEKRSVFQGKDRRSHSKSCGITEESASVGNELSILGSNQEGISSRGCWSRRPGIGGHVRKMASQVSLPWDVAFVTDRQSCRAWICGSKQLMFRNPGWGGYWELMHVSSGLDGSGVPVLALTRAVWPCGSLLNVSKPQLYPPETRTHLCLREWCRFNGLRNAKCLVANDHGSYRHRAAGTRTQ